MVGIVDTTKMEWLVHNFDSKSSVGPQRNPIEQEDPVQTMAHEEE